MLKYLDLGTASLAFLPEPRLLPIFLNLSRFTSLAPVGKYPVGKYPVGKTPVGKYPAPVVTKG